MNRETLSNWIAKWEGEKEHVYLDNSKEQHPTIGIGFNLDRSDARELIQGLGLNYEDVRSGTQGLNQEQINYLFQHDLDNALHDAHQFVDNFDELPEDMQIALTDMAFNLGADKLSHFTELKAAIESGDRQLAAEEMKDSLWYGQVGEGNDQRGGADVNLLQHGSFEQNDPITVDGHIHSLLEQSYEEPVHVTVDQPLIFLEPEPSVYAYDQGAPGLIIDHEPDPIIETVYDNHEPIGHVIQTDWISDNANDFLAENYPVQPTEPVANEWANNVDNFSSIPASEAVNIPEVASLDNWNAIPVDDGSIFGGAGENSDIGHFEIAQNDYTEPFHQEQNNGGIEHDPTPDPTPTSPEPSHDTDWGTGGSTISDYDTGSSSYDSDSSI